MQLLNPSESRLIGALESVRGPLCGGALGSSRGAASWHHEKQGELTLRAPIFLFSFLLPLGGVHTLWQTSLSLISFFQKLLLTQVQVFRDGETGVASYSEVDVKQGENRNRK